jgi:hypothetical protein
MHPAQDDRPGRHQLWGAYGARRPAAGGIRHGRWRSDQIGTRSAAAGQEAFREVLTKPPAGFEPAHTPRRGLLCMALACGNILTGVVSGCVLGAAHLARVPGMPERGRWP